MRGWVCIAVVLALSGGCANSAWRAAERANTGDAYRAFITTNPDHRRAQEARSRAESLDWEQAVQLDTPGAYLAYVGAHPDGAHAADAAAAAEDRAWRDADADGSPEALGSFLVQFRDTARRAEVEERIEAGFYERAVSENTEDAWSRYLLRYPDGQFVEAAKAERERLAWAATEASNSRNAYERFAAKYAMSDRRALAMDWIERSRVLVLQPVVVLGEASVSDAQRPALARQVRRELEQSLLYELRQDFRILRTVMVDLRGGPEPHPQEAYGIKPDTGLLVLTYRDAAGREFKPSGRATDISAKLELYAPPTNKPTWATTFEASTPGRVRGQTEATLRQGAITEMGERMIGFSDSLRDERRTIR